MVFARRTAALRLTAMAALAASAILISDGLHPDRAFCPLEQACEAARASALGSLFGVPTSVLGAAAFGGLFFLTLLPVEWGRRLLQLAGFLAAVAGAGFILYQAMVLRTFCPLCLVADGAGLLAGLITLTWPRPPVRISGRRLRGEGGTSRLAWTLAGVLAVAVPFAWPRPEAPSWVEIPAQAMWAYEDGAFLDEDEPAAPVPPTPPYGAAPIGAEVPWPPSAIVSTTAGNTPEELAAEQAAGPGAPEAEDLGAVVTPRLAGGAPPGPRAVPRRAPRPAPTVGPPPPAPAVVPDRVEAELDPYAPPVGATRAPTTPRSRPSPAPPQVEQPGPATDATPEAGATAGTHATPDATPTGGAATTPEPVEAGDAPKPARSRRGPVIVEYLNAYCGHCRATHQRLERVLREMGVQVHRRRIYAWASQDYPLWVRACAFARHQGVEERLFQELLRAPNQSPRAVYAAARRAGLDVVALQCAIDDPDVPEELVRDCKRMKSAGLKGLPTLDIGRRRLMGEQTEAELREAIRAALAEAGKQ